MSRAFLASVLIYVLAIFCSVVRGGRLSQKSRQLLSEAARLEVVQNEQPPVGANQVAD